MVNKEPLSIVENTMSLDEAREIKWLRSNPRPLGELLDEGYLTEARLKWAAEKAFAPELKQAAQVLLRSIGKPPQAKTEKSQENFLTPFPSESFHIQITLEQARKTAWPFNPYKGQLIGGLLDTKQLSLKELGYAIENAWDDRVRKAAITLTLAQLKQVLEDPAPSAGFLNVVKSPERSFSERKQLAYSFLQGGFLGAGIAVAVAVVIVSIMHLTSSETKFLPQYIATLATPSGILVEAIMLILCFGVFKLAMYLMDWVVDGLEKQISNHRLGQEGEDNVIERIRPLLDGSWYLFRNLVLPGLNKSDIDAVLIGPPGLWVLEIKTFNGKYRVIDDQWQYQKNNAWKPVKSNPTRQAVNNAVRLSEFLKANNIKEWVTPVVVWASHESTLTIQNSTTNIWMLEQLSDEIGNLLNTQKISDANQKIMVDKLTQLYLNNP